MLEIFAQLKIPPDELQFAKHSSLSQYMELYIQVVKLTDSYLVAFLIPRFQLNCTHKHIEQRLSKPT